MKSTDLQFLLMGVGVIALAGYKYYLEHPFTGDDAIRIGAGLVLVCASYTLLAVICWRGYQAIERGANNKLEQRVQERKQRLLKENKQSLQFDGATRKQKIEELKESFKKIEPCIKSEPTKEKLRRLQKYYDELFENAALIDNHYAEENSKVAKKVLDAIRHTNQQLVAIKKAEEEKIDLNQRIHKEKDLEIEQRKILVQNGYIRSMQWGVKNPKKGAMYYVRPRHNESAEHYFLTMLAADGAWAIGATNVRTPNSRGPDVLFDIHGRTWAIEIETGSVKKKKPEEFQKKYKLLNDDYGTSWFTLLSRSSLQNNYESNLYHTTTRGTFLDIMKKIGQGSKPWE